MTATTFAKPQHVLITGAAGAIGAAVARAMRAAWPATRFALLDRDAAELTALAAELGHSSTHGVDLRAVDALPAFVASLDPLDGLVNCAGVMWINHIAGSTWDAAADLMAIDLLAPLRLQDLVVRALVARNAPGAIVNVASMAGKVPLKGGTYYGAAKAGLAMASEIARAELAPHHIRVLTVYPGPVRSALEQGARDAYGGGRWFGGLAPTGDPAELAARIVTAVERDDARVIYPRIYGVGHLAPNLSSWIALAYGPSPIS